LLVESFLIFQAFETEPCLSQNISCWIVGKVCVRSNILICFVRVAVWHNNEFIRPSLPNIDKTV
jgi:hypothetical protein